MKGSGMSVPATHVAPSSSREPIWLGSTLYLACGLVSLAFVWSAVAGLINFDSRLREYSLGFADSVAAPGVIGASVVPIVELGLGMGWFLVFPQWRWIVECAMLGVLAVSIAGLLSRQNFLSALPDCNCPSLLLARRANIDAATHSLGIDGVMSAIVLVTLGVRFAFSRLIHPHRPYLLEVRAR